MKPVTASFSTGKLGRKFGYYRCHRAKGHVNVRAELVDAAFVVLLERLVPKPERMELIAHMFRQVWATRVEAATSEATAYRRELAQLLARKERVLGQMADGAISSEDFATLHKGTTEAISDMRDRLASAESNELDLDTALGYLKHILWNTASVWESASLREKHSIQRRTFPDGLVWLEKGFGTPVTHSIYTLLVDDSVRDAVLVAPQGFRCIEYNRLR